MTSRARLAPFTYHVRRTLALSCEAVPASIMGRRGHSAAPPLHHGAAESFVSFIALFDRAVRLLGGWISAAHATPTGRSSVPGHAVSCRPFPNGTRPAWSDIARHAEPPRLWTQMNSHILYVVHAAACGATDAQASDEKPDPFRCATVSLIENACLSSGRGAEPIRSARLLHSRIPGSTIARSEERT